MINKTVKKGALFLGLLFLIAGLPSYAQPLPAQIQSPDGKVKVSVYLNDDGQALYAVALGRDVVLKPSQLGLKREDEDFSRGLSFLSVSAVEKVADRYHMIYAKRKECVYQANKRTLHFRAADKQAMDIIFQVSNDGVAFKYAFPGKSTETKTITEEATSFHFPLSAKAWLQPMQVAKTGWERTNPAYEEHYKQNIEVGTPAPTAAGWVYPALFQVNNNWVLVTEAGLDSSYCGSRLEQESPDGMYRVGFPDSREEVFGGGILPKSKLPFSSPWRVITIGSLKTITESTLGTDLARPTVRIDRTFIKPGKASWSWIMSKDDSIVYSEQKRYIDFAAHMRWQYCLIDADWDRKIGYDRVKELSSYAASKDVGLLLWYNSSGNWNTVKYTPKNKLLTHEDREKEFKRLQEMGIKGVKIDFFGGDGRSVIQYYLDILEDAARYKLMVNFHGATLPRGWARTYPNLLTTEAVRGFEMVTFGQGDADLEATHCAMLPFTRNAFDPMDFTPMNLYRIPTQVKRKTTGAFELALSVLFLSGIQHFAESPAGMTHVSGPVQQVLRELPNSWDEVRFIEGFPGKYVVLARRAGNRWYIAGINGENQEKRLSLDLSTFKKRKAKLITDSSGEEIFTTETFTGKLIGSKSLILQPHGGFLMLLE